MPQVGIIIFENQGYSKIITGGTYPTLTSTNCPTMASLANTYRLMKPYAGVSNPSLPNYCGLISGSLLGNAAKDTPSPAADGFAGQQPNLFHQLDAAGYSWKNYAEDITYWDSTSRSVKDFYPGDTAWKTNPNLPYFANRHVPGTFFDTTDGVPASGSANGLHDFRTPTGAGTWVTGSGTLIDDINNSSLPDFFIINPNLPDCGHGFGAVSGSVTRPDNWLSGATVVGDGYSQATPKFPGVGVPKNADGTGGSGLLGAMNRGGTLIVTYDNDGSGTGQVFCVFAGASYAGLSPFAPPAGATADHYWLLWSISKLFNQVKLETTNYDGTPLTYAQVGAYTGLTNTQVLPLVAGNTPNASLSPPTWAFPTAIAPGASSAQESFTLDNSLGTATLNVASIALTDAVNFTISAGAGLVAVAAGATATIGVKFTPPSTAAHGASFPCTLTVTDNSGGIANTTQTASITATTTSLVSTPHATLSPVAGSVNNMGTVPAGAAVATTVTITNDGTASLTITNIAIGSSGRADNNPTRFTTTQ